MSHNYPKPPYPSQKQSMPGSTAMMDPRPDHGEDSYRGSGRLNGMKAVITGGDSGIERAVAIAYARLKPHGPSQMARGGREKFRLGGCDQQVKAILTENICPYPSRPLRALPECRTANNSVAARTAEARRSIARAPSCPH